MIIESILLSATVIYVSSLRFVRKIVSDQKKAELQEEKEIRDQETKDRAEELKAVQQTADYELLKSDPALCKARLQTIHEKRKIILYERSEWENDHRSTDGTNWWTEVMSLNVKLDRLAEEERNIPLLEGVEEFRLALQAKEDAFSKNPRGTNKKKRDVLERERKTMEGRMANAAHLSERADAQQRLKEITTELNKLVD